MYLTELAYTADLTVPFADGSIAKRKKNKTKQFYQEVKGASKLVRRIFLSM